MYFSMSYWKNGDAHWSIAILGGFYFLTKVTQQKNRQVLGFWELGSWNFVGIKSEFIQLVVFIQPIWKICAAVTSDRISPWIGVQTTTVLFKPPPLSHGWYLSGKNRLIPWNPGWFIGILILAYEIIPIYLGMMSSPTNPLNNQGFGHSHGIPSSAGGKNAPPWDS